MDAGGVVTPVTSAGLGGEFDWAVGVNGGRVEAIGGGWAAHGLPCGENASVAEPKKDETFSSFALIMFKILSEYPRQKSMLKSTCLLAPSLDCRSGPDLSLGISASSRFISSSFGV